MEDLEELKHPAAPAADHGQRAVAQVAQDHLARAGLVELTFSTVIIRVVVVAAAIMAAEAAVAITSAVHHSQVVVAVVAVQALCRQVLLVAAGIMQALAR
jgi:hypothetical protein